MEAGSISKRYARALLELAQPEGKVDAVLAELEGFEQLLKSSSMLSVVMTNPSVSSEQRVLVLRDVLATMKYSTLSNRFLLLIAQKRRMPVFSDILREFRNSCDEMKGIVRVTVTSAAPVAADLEKQLVGQIETMTKKKVMLTREVNPALLGGIMTRVGGLLIDGSLSTQLSRLKSSLLEEQVS
jgi:F-type H+-transporting ATPase subunit delta